MTNDQAQKIILILTAIVLALRWINGMRLAEVPRHKIWTYSLSLGAWLTLYLRLAISRNFDLVAPFDPLATLVWAFVLFAQSAGFLYEWTTPQLRQRFARRRVR